METIKAGHMEASQQHSHVTHTLEPYLRQRGREMSDHLKKKGSSRFICVLCVCVCVDLRSVLLLSVMSRSVTLCPGLEEERGGLSLSSVVSSENAQKTTTLK